MRTSYWLTLGIGLALRAQADALVLVWEVDRADQATGFVLTAKVDGQANDSTYPIPASPPGAFQPANGQAHPDTYCADLGALPPGRYQFTMQARIEGGLTDSSSPLRCTVTADGQCHGGGMQDGRCTHMPTPAPTPLPEIPIPSVPDVPPEEPVAPPVAHRPPPPTTTPARPPMADPVPLPPVATHPKPQPQPPPAVAQSAPNLVAAPTAAQPWRGGSFAGTQSQTTLDASTQRDGQATQQITGSGPYYGTSTSTNFPVTAGQTYEVSAWVKTQDITDFVELDVFYWGTKGETLSRWGEAVGGRLKGTQEWTPLTGQITIPPKAVRAVIQLRVKSTGGTAWVDAVAMRAQTQAGVGTSAPPRELEVTPAQSPLPPKPEAPTLLPPPAPAQTRQALRAQYDVLKHDYQAALTTIKTAYATTLKALQGHWTPQAQQQEAQAREAGNAQMQALYQALLEARKPLDAQWKEAR